MENRTNREELWHEQDASDTTANNPGANPIEASSRAIDIHAITIPANAIEQAAPATAIRRDTEREGDQAAIGEADEESGITRSIDSQDIIPIAQA